MLRCRLQIFFLMIASCFFKYAIAQNEIIPLPLNQLNRDSLSKIIEQKEKQKDYRGLGEIYGGIYNYFLYTSFRDSAMMYAGKAEENTLRAGDSAKYYFTQLQVAQFNTGIDSLLALAYYNKALAYYVRTKNYTLQCNALGGLSWMYGLYKDTIKLLNYLEQAEKILKITKDTFNMVGANDKRIHILMNRNKIDSTISLLYKNLQLIEHATKIGNSESQRIFWKGWQLNLLADCYYRKRNYEKAINILKQARQYDTVTSYFDAQNSFRYHLLINSFVQADKKDSAIKYTDTFFSEVLKEFNSISPQKISKLTAKYEAEKKQRRIDELQLQNHLQQLKVSTQRKLNIAFIIVLALALITVYFIIKNIQHKKRMQLKFEMQKAELAKNEAVETERYRISSELHDDIGSGLSTIRLLSEMMKEGAGESNMQLQLGKISESSKELVQNMNEIVWALNINNDTLQSLLAYIRQYAVKTLDNVGVDCVIKMPDEVPSVSIAGNERRNIFLMVKECVHNIIKHSKGSNVNIEISLNENLCIKIHDNGIGFSNMENDVHHFGLTNLKQRAKELNGCIEWQQNSGTTVQIQIPLSSVSHKSVMC